MLSVTNETWKKEQPQIVSTLKQRGLILMQMQNISLIHFLIKVLKRLLPVSLTQVTELEAVSNRMEKAGLIKVRDEVKENNLKLNQLTTNRHFQI